MKHIIAVTTIFSTLLLVTPSIAGSLVIDRVWQSGDFGYALVTYTNKTNKTFASAVTIKCIAFDSSGNRLGVNQRSFFAHDRGPIPPGFQDTVEVPINLHGSQMSSIECKCRER